MDRYDYRNGALYEQNPNVTTNLSDVTPTYRGQIAEMIRLANQYANALQKVERLKELLAENIVMLTEQTYTWQERDAFNAKVRAELGESC